MPPKIRKLIAELEKAGFKNRGGKGSHRNFTHEKGLMITVSGNQGDEAKKYQIKKIKDIIERSKK